jgi:hypothetical protein
MHGKQLLHTHALFCALKALEITMQFVKAMTQQSNHKNFSLLLVKIYSLFEEIFQFAKIFSSKREPRVKLAYKHKTH